MTHYEIISKLIGPIEPVGDHGVDTARLANLDDAIEVVLGLVYSIQHAAAAHVRTQASMKAIGEKARGFLGELHDETGVDTPG